MNDFDPERYKGRYKYPRTDRNYESIRQQCLKRDKRKCKMCGSKKSLQVHHIIEYSKSRALREELSNLITLCSYHHRSIKGNEKHYVEYFHSLLNE